MPLTKFAGGSLGYRRLRRQRPTHPHSAGSRLVQDGNSLLVRSRQPKSVIVRRCAWCDGMRVEHIAIHAPVRVIQRMQPKTSEGPGTNLADAVDAKLNTS